MAPSTLKFFALTVLLSTISPSQSQYSKICSLQTFANNQSYAQCIDLPTLTSFLHWTYNPANCTLSVAFVAVVSPTTDGWISWAINPTGTGMIGAQSLIAFKGSNGAMTVKTYNVSSYALIRESNVWYRVQKATAESYGGVMCLFATVVLPRMRTTTINHVWQVGAVRNGVPAKHALQPANFNSKGTIDLVIGESNNGKPGGGGRFTWGKIHGMLCAISWGVMIPLGIMIARYMKRINRLEEYIWFQAHRGCQLAACAIGFVGWAIGICLRITSKGVHYNAHLNIGIGIIFLATLQVVFGFQRPKEKPKYKKYWNIAHYVTGWSVLFLGIINVFEGLNILRPPKQWKIAYTCIVALLVLVSLILEAILREMERN